MREIPIKLTGSVLLLTILACSIPRAHPVQVQPALVSPTSAESLPGDDLTLGCCIGDLDVGPGNENDTLFDGQTTVDTSDLSPDTTPTQTIPGDYLDVILKIELFPFGE